MKRGRRSIRGVSVGGVCGFEGKGRDGVED